MKQLDPMVFVAVFQAMLGPFFWILTVLILLGALALIWVLRRDGGIHSRRLLRAEIFGLAGGVAAVALMLWMTNSTPVDLLGGPIDWLLTIAIWFGGFIAATIASYVVISFTIKDNSDHSRAFRR
jgi:peptidoglycan biosynthesis protein MviN/MurJ (putative lipid II flippase)